MLELRLRVLESSVSITASDEDRGILPILQYVLGTYGDSSEPAQLHYYLDGARGAVWRDGLSIYQHAQRSEVETSTSGERQQSSENLASSADLVAALELDLFRQTIRGAVGLPLHAACVACRHERPDSLGALALAGPSGSGKSTLAGALLRAGAKYISDETISLDESGLVTGLRRPIGLDRETPESVPSADTVIYRRELTTASGALRQSLLLLPPRHRLWDDTAPVRLRTLVFLEYTPQQPARFRSIAFAEALERLWACSLRQEATFVAHATRLLGGLQVVSLSTRDIHEARDMLLGLTASWTPLPTARPP